MNEWTFDEAENYWVDIPSETIRFEAYLDGERYVFAVSQIALNDYHETEDTQEDAEQNFLDNYGRIKRVAVRCCEEYEVNDEPPHYFIGSSDYARFS